MYEEIKEYCDIFAENREIIRKRYKLDSILMSLVYAEKDMKAEIEKLSYCEELLKQKVSSETVFRQAVRIPLIFNMAYSENPEKFLDNASEIYGIMDEWRKEAPDYAAMAAVFLADRIGPGDAGRIVGEACGIYRDMKKKHRLSTSACDMPLAAMLAAACRDRDRLELETSACYEILKKTFKSGGARQSLSLLISICSSDVILTCKRAEDIFNGLKEKKHRFGSGTETSVLGIAAALDGDVEEITDDIIWADEYLKNEKGFGTLAVSAETRRMYAAIMVIRARLSGEDVQSASDIRDAIEIMLIIVVTHMIVDVSTASILDER